MPDELKPYRVCDLTGNKFGKLTVISYAGIEKHKKAIWLCKCDCGKEVIVIGSHMKSGNTTSCGCYRSLVQNSRPHLFLRKLANGAYARNKKLYALWSTMIHRCENPRRIKFKDYGGRGISVCDAWHSPHDFMDWAYANGYAPGLQLDRINNDGNYCPENCRFVTPQENSCNRRNTRRVTVHGKTYVASEAAREFNISSYTIYWWIKSKGRHYAEQRLANI